jgi:hypothetical protein
VEGSGRGLISGMMSVFAWSNWGLPRIICQDDPYRNPDLIPPPGHYATSRKVAGSISDGVIGFFNWPDPSTRTMALGSTQPLTEMSTRNLPGGKGRPARKADLTAIWEPDVSQPYGPPWSVAGNTAGVPDAWLQRSAKFDETKGNERNVSKGDNGVVIRRVGDGKEKKSERNWIKIESCRKR